MSSKLILLLAVTLTAAGTAAAAPRSIADCETVRAADAYNLCLASFGPAPGRRGRSNPDVVRKQEHSRQETGAGVRIEEGRRGRARMVLTPKR